MIERKVFFNSLEIEPVDQRTCEPGLFRSVAQSRVAEALVLVADGARWIVDLTEGDRQFLFYRLQPNDRSSRFGMLTRDVTVEVDRDGAYEADMLVGSPGDMILSDGKWFIVAVNPQGFRDPTPIGLWDASDLSRGNNAIGFKSWRLTVGTGLERQVIWQRAMP